MTEINLWPSCQHPHTPENTYVVTELRKSGPVATERCKTCTLSRGKLHYERKMGRAPKVPSRLPAFCQQCREGECGRSHRRVDCRCLRPVCESSDAPVCVCGSAWALTWKREMGLRGGPKRPVTFIHRKAAQR